jgi:hypothetical protein
MDIIVESGEACEGNCFLLHGTNVYSDELINKQMNMFACGMNANNIVNIGFNAGHSTLVFLLADSLSKITVFDNGSHKYMRPCYDYLASIFPERLNLIEGDSVHTIQEYVKNNNGKKYDVINIDGNHDNFHVISDLENTRLLCTSDTFVIINEYHAPNIKSIVHNYESCNQLAVVKGQLPTHLYEHIITTWSLP